MKQLTIQPPAKWKAGNQITKEISNLNGSYINQLPISLRDAGRDLVKSLTGARFASQDRDGYCHLVTKDNKKVLVYTPTLRTTTTGSRSYHVSTELNPLAYLSQDKLPDSIVLVLYNPLKEGGSVDVFEFDLKGQGDLKVPPRTCYVGWSTKKGRYLKNSEKMVWSSNLKKASSPFSK